MQAYWLLGMFAGVPARRGEHHEEGVAHGGQGIAVRGLQSRLPERVHQQRREWL